MRVLERFTARLENRAGRANRESGLLDLQAHLLPFEIELGPGHFDVGLRLANLRRAEAAEKNSREDDRATRGATSLENGA